MSNGVAMKCCRNGLKWTPLPPGESCLISLSHPQYLVVLLIKVTSLYGLCVFTVAAIAIIRE